MMAGADEPATLSGFCQPMAIAMAKKAGVVDPGCSVASLSVISRGKMNSRGLWSSLSIDNHLTDW